MNSQVHKVYINEKSLVFLQTYETNRISSAVNIQVISEAAESIESVITNLENEKELKNVIFLSETPDVAWNRFVSLYKLVPAAGGLVSNGKGEFLMIFRRGKWDLPKGKIDYEETPEDAGMREVREECGIRKLEIKSPLPVTFHTYSERGKKILKKTYWFLMLSGENESLVPQTEEDIEKAVWMSVPEIREKAFPNIYISIREMLEDYFKTLN